MNKKQKNHVKKGDLVIIISGKEKKKLATIQTILTKKSKVILESIDIQPRIKYVRSSTPKQEPEKKKNFSFCASFQCYVMG